TYITRKYILLNFLIDRRVDVRIRRALAVNHINDLGKDGITYDIMNFIEHNFSRNQEVHSGVFSLIIESLFYLDANVAEEYLILLLKRFRNNKKIASELTGAIQNRTVSEKHYKFFVAYLKDEKKSAIRQSIIQILTNTKDSQFVIPFLSLIKDPKESVVMKKKAIEAIGEVGDNHIIPMLKELSVDSNPDIYNSAFTALKKIERRSAFEESYLLKADIREVNITEEEIDTLLFDEEKRFPKVKIFKDNKEVIEVEYVMINLGPISGLIFYIIATNARIDRPINIDVISAKLDENSIFIDKTRIKGRIAAIRKMMREKLGDKVDPYFLIENVRRFGYRLNASVSIE
ncbi:HEAT repeat domain-containing protein, partial [bacterium]|nr:HEAT repeat domain-containing protein [bacterium]